MRLPRPSAEVQKETIGQIVITKKVNEGDTWYIISKKWFEGWENYVEDSGGSDIDAPGPIDNQSLIDADNTLLNVEEGRDFDLIAEEAWNLLIQWYSGGPALPRKAIKLNTRNYAVVEVRPLTVHFSHKQHGIVSKEVSKADTIGDIKKAICKRWELNPSEAEVWDAVSNSLVEEMDKQVAELNIFDGQTIYVNNNKLTIGGNGEEPEASNADGERVQEPSTYPSSSNSRSTYTPTAYHSSPYTYYDTTKRYTPGPPGLVGLSNLGNTCFMNSSLQCLSNTVPLTEFFLSGAYVRDINTENPLGLKGKLAEEFARLIREMWSGQNSSVAPRDFKLRLERFASQFTGYQQHDSQELLAFLLDGLHEDLNRVKNKLYASVREGDDILDEERAKESWAIHKGRNDSVVVDWFQASLKSTLVCPTCSRVSVTFDPFMYLSLPLPMRLDRSIPLTLVTREFSKLPVKYLVKVPKTGSIATLKRVLGEMSGIPPECLFITDVFKFKFFKKFNDNESIDAIDEDRDVIFAYEVLPQPADGPQLVHCPVYHKKDEPRPYYSMMGSTELFGIPFFVSVPSDITYRELYNTLIATMSRWLKPGYREANKDDRNNHNDEEDANGEHDGDGYGGDAEDDAPTNSINHNHSASEQGDQSGNQSEEEILSDDEGTSKGITVLSSSKENDALFTITSIDSHGYQERTLPDNDAPLDLYNQTIALHWKTSKLEWLDEIKLKTTTLHSSMTTIDPADQDGITLDKCLALYTTTERLGPDDPWYCNKCKEFRQATKKFDLWSSPRILVIHLKRFSYRNRLSREKLETLVTYPLRGLDLVRHIIGPPIPAPIYDLYAVSNHYGSLGGGHYTAYALNKSTNKWYKFDDSYVSEIDESEVVSSSAYVLFYRRRDTLSIPAVPPTPDTPPDPSTTTDGPTQQQSSSSQPEASEESRDAYYHNHINYNNGTTTSHDPSSSSSSSSHMDLD